MISRLLLLTLLSIPFCIPAHSADNEIDSCLQHSVLLPENLESTVAELKAACEAAFSAQGSATLPETGSASVQQDATVLFDSSDSSAISSFFQPYKKNYIAAGSMKNRDGTPAFSGNSTDIKFELGMKFNLFPGAEDNSLLSPLHFGYSQKSWWDILEPSAPFREHNYNPEIFWEFDRSQARSTTSFQPSSWLDLLRIDRFGFEHQSNGLNEEGSRSWDRVYVEREYSLSEMFSFNVKLWNIVNKGNFNDDIADYLGYGALTSKVDLNNWLEIELLTYSGTGTDKVSYQLDLIVPMSRWVNSKFFLTYFDGYGEALINYNKKSKSLRAGFYFPLDLLAL